jgi:hypothetical protein
MRRSLMKPSIIPLLIALSMPAAAVFGQAPLSPQPHENDLSKFVGVWRGEFDGLPGVDIVICDEGGHMTGGILFYLHLRPNAHLAYISKPGLPEPLFGMQLDGKTLSFQVSHRRAHPPGSLNDPPVHFHLNLTEPGKAVLVNEDESGDPSLVLVRSDY